jgi:hypothetical protein|tara:strand:- start:656 stop:829 length:174 start_codon:yes stop_codon:yes gene_type:complete
MKDIIKEVLDYYSDTDLTEDFLREDLALVIAEKIKIHVDKMFMEEYEMIIKPSTSPF